MKICAICGRPAECVHHLIFGRGLRKLADEDYLVIDMCNHCHNMAQSTTEQLHDNPMAEALSKMLGQALYERNYILKHMTVPFADDERPREKFRERYGRSYL